MKKITTLLFVLIITASAFAQFPIGHMSINFKDASRTGGFAITGSTVVTMSGTGRSIGTEVYYPATSTGDNVNVASGNFPVVVFGHGFAMTWDAYNNVFDRLASLGYIVLALRTESGILPTPSHVDFGLDERFVANQGMLLNTVNTPTAVAKFNGKVLQKSAIGGHSMGAGASFLAAASNNTLTCLFNFAAATTNNSPNSIAQASLVTVPTLMISGGGDSVADSLVQNSHYNNTAATKKFHVIIKDLTHCEFGDGDNTTCSIGQAPCGNTTCNTAFFKKYMNYLEPFLANQLKSDCVEGTRFMDSIQIVSSPKIGRKITGTIACTSVSTNDINNIAYLAIYPNPSQSIVNIDMNLVKNMDTKISITNQLGQIVFSEIKSSESQQLKMPINCESWNNGIYFITINAGEKSVIQKFVKL